MQPTPEQQCAIETHDKNLIVVAGAGSGKTRVLVERYLKLLENNQDWKLNSLVAITFTREAAFEMRNRVRQSLEENLHNSTGDATGHWSQLLSAMDTARIDTIHGLCGTILRANAAEAGIDPKFEVLDEVDASILLEDVVADVLQNLSSNEARLFSEYESSAVIGTLTNAQLINIALAEISTNPADIMASWHELWVNNVLSAYRRLIQSQLIQAALTWQDKSSYPKDDKLAEIYLKVHDAFDELAKLESAHDIVELLGGMASGINLRSGSAKTWGTKEIVDEAKEHLGNIRDNIRSALIAIGQAPNEIDQHAARLIPLWYSVILQVQASYRQAKLDNSQLDFDDLERITAQLLTDNESIRQRYRNAEFKHILVDEFQDTNQAQWNIIQALADLTQGGSLFVVGDPKQSIYQFRGADVSVFNRVRDQIADIPSGDEAPLSHSFRTNKRLLELMNKLFKRILVRDNDSPVRDFEVLLDKEMTAQRKESPKEPVLECLLVASQSSGRTKVVINEDGEEQRIGSGEMRRWEAYELANHIHAMVKNERIIYDKRKEILRPVDYGDIAILFQSMRNVTIYEEVFKARDIPFVTIAGRGYYSRQEVWDMLDLLKALHNPADNLSLASVLRSPMFGFSDNILLTLRLLNDENNRAIPLWDALTISSETSPRGISESELERIQFAHVCLSELRLMAGRVTISELLRHALARTGYMAMLTGLPDGARRRGNIEKLLQLAEASGKITLGKFSQYLDDLTAREIREGEALLEAVGALRIMTVHASKGLEFPIVILADASWERGAGGGADKVIADDEGYLSCQIFDANENKYINSFMHDYNYRLQNLKEDAERKRLLYVAATRAQDFLIISGQANQRSNGEWSFSGWLKQIMNALEVDDLDLQAEQFAPFANDQIRILLSQQAPAPQYLITGTKQQAQLWDFEADESDFPPIAPPLIASIRLQQDKQIGHIAATQLADLGGGQYAYNAQQREFYRERFRRSTLHDVPARVQDLSAERKPDVSQRIIGEIVHEALRYWRFDLDPLQFTEMLRGYAWQKGLTFNSEIDVAVRRSKGLLLQFQQSKIFKSIQSARSDKRPLFSELPFILRTDKRIIHGVIDLLFQQEDGSWAIIDYKTSTVNDARYQDHAKRYHLQIGVYSAAVQQQLGAEVIPQVFIHYIRYNETVEIPASAWQAELSQLEAYIGDLVTTHD